MGWSGRGRGSSRVERRGTVQPPARPRLGQHRPVASGTVLGVAILVCTTTAGHANADVVAGMPLRV